MVDAWSGMVGALACLWLAWSVPRGTIALPSCLDDLLVTLWDCAPLVARVWLVFNVYREVVSVARIAWFCVVSPSLHEEFFRGKKTISEDFDRHALSRMHSR